MEAGPQENRQAHADMIPKKQQSSQGDWSAALDLAYREPDLPRAERLVEQAVEEIHRLQREYGHVALAWSGGKDSQALRYVAEQAGIAESVLVISEVEWPAFLEWATDNMPWGLWIEQRPFGVEWIRDHPEMLFPDTKNAARWFKMIQQDGQRVYMKRAGGQCLLLGRRRKDGNFVSKDGSNQYRDRNGWVRASPIADWSHEDVLCVLGAYDLSLPPCYSWPRGFRIGTNAWPIRQWCPSQEYGWNEVWQIDPEVVRMAAEANVPGARATLVRCAG